MTDVIKLLLNFAEKNPQLVEQLLAGLCKLLTNNPDLLNRTMEAGIAHLESK